MNRVKQGKHLKQTYRAPEGSPPVRSKGEGSRPQPERPQPEENQPESQQEPPQAEQPEEKEEERPWVHKPFAAIIANYKQVKDQYLILERTLESISLHLDVEPRHLLEHIQTLPKPQELTNLQARVDCLLKKNAELKTKVEEGEALWKETVELKDRMAALEEVKTAQEERDKAKEVAQKIHAFMGFPGDVINKARLYDQGLKQPETSSRAKMMRCMVDYSTKMEKLLKELRALLQPTGVQPEPASTSIPVPGPSTVPVSTPSLGFVTPPINRPDSFLQEAIPEISTEDIASLRTWAARGPENLTTLIIESRGTHILGNLSTPGSISHEALRRAEEQTKKRAEDSVSESGSSEEEEEEDNPIFLSSNKEEYQGSETPSDPVDESETLSFQMNRPTTRSTPGRPTTHPKRKATGRKSAKEKKKRHRG